ncbi:MAG TPA: hypothetical protein DDZ81_19620 [Acetobacteraceae bacterium]|jgi:hypothetical protein|nr:hypothetical protein [Acetobacteraceae bacterium]
MSEKIIEREYEAAFANVASTNPVFPYRAKLQMLRMVEEKIKVDATIRGILKERTDYSVKAGKIFEQYVPTTFNMDANLMGIAARAQTDRDKGLISRNHQVVDIAIVDDGNIVKTAQAKVNEHALKTAKEHSKLLDDKSAPKYEAADVALMPADQVESAREKAIGLANKHRAMAEETAKQGGSSAKIQVNKAQAKAYEQTAQKASGTIEYSGASSAPLTKSEADDMSKGNLSKLETKQSQYKTRSTLQNMRDAASGAAAMSAVVAGTVNVVNYVGLVRAGKIDASEAVVKIAAETAASAADSAIKAAATTGLQSMIVRLGSREAAQSMASQSVSALLRSNAISVGVVCAIDAIKDLVLFGAGKLTLAELEERSGKNLFSTAAGTVGGSIGASICGGLAIGGVLAPAALPVLGGLAGGLIASMAMAFAIENGIEAPYRELVTNTQTLRESAIILQDVSNRFFEGQVYFEQFMAADAALDQSFNEQAAIIKRSGEDMRQAIDRI